MASSIWCPSPARVVAQQSPAPKMVMKSAQVQAVELKKALVGAAAAAAVMMTSSSAAVAVGSDGSSGYEVYYGTAASAANYGGYGGNSSKKASAEYVYDVPEGWKERLVSKVEKGTNGTDSEFNNPKRRKEKEYLTFLAGYRQLAPREVILNNLALSDVELQDQIAAAEKVKSEEVVKEGGQVYYVYEIESGSDHSLISVTCANNKLYAHFVKAPAVDWNRDSDMLTHIHRSFSTLSRT